MGKPFLLLMSALLLLVPVLAQQEAADSAAGGASPSGVSPSSEYLIGNGDVLQISVWGQPQLSHAATVRPDGKISLPLISDVSLSGLTVMAAQTFLQEKLTPYVKHPQVAVQVVEVHSKVVYVTGEVLRPGAYTMVNPTTVVQLVIRAGGVTDFAKTKRVYILRPPHGERIPINLRAALQGHHSDLDLPLSVGDTVVVP